MCVCVDTPRAHTPACVHPYVTHRAAVPGIDVVTTKWVFGFYLQDQIALEEDHLDATSDNNMTNIELEQHWLDQS